LCKALGHGNLDSLARHEMSYAAADELSKTMEGEVSTNFYPFFFYNHVEGFYDLFYGDKTEVDPVIQLCIIGVSPAVGPETGDTAVTVHLSGYTPKQQKTFYCRFGDTKVHAVGSGRHRAPRIQLISTSRLSRRMASYDVASSMCQSLPRGSARVFQRAEDAGVGVQRATTRRPLRHRGAAVAALASHQR